jgi:hypothetical protein
LFLQRRVKIDDRLQTSALGRSWLEELKVAPCIDSLMLCCCLFSHCRVNPRKCA